MPSTSHRLPLPTASEEESGASGPAQPLPSKQTFAFQTQIRRYGPSRESAWQRHGPTSSSCSHPSPIFSPPDHFHLHLPQCICQPLLDLPPGLASLRLGSGLGHPAGWPLTSLARASSLGAASAWCGSAGRRPVGACWLPRSCPATPRTGLPRCRNTRPSRACATPTWRSCRLPTSAPDTWSSSWSCALGLSCSLVWPRGERAGPGLDSGLRTWPPALWSTSGPPPGPACTGQLTRVSQQSWAFPPKPSREVWCFPVAPRLWTQPGCPSPHAP